MVLSRRLLDENLNASLITFHIGVWKKSKSKQPKAIMPPEEVLEELSEVEVKVR